jgi:HEPN domain-containing protein
MDNRVRYWLDLADYDLESAKVMHNGKRFLYVGFMCHQTIEKALKGLMAKDSERVPPKIHNLIKLSEMARIRDVMTDEQKDFLRELNPLNVESRYPEYKDKILQTLTPQLCAEILAKTEVFLCWIKQQL